MIKIETHIKDPQLKNNGNPVNLKDKTEFDEVETKN